CRQFIPWPADSQDVSSALQSIAASMTSDTSSHCIAVIGAGGGAGATTVAVNLVVELASVIKDRCALVDMDLLFGDAACALDVTPEHSIADVCHDSSAMDSSVVARAVHELPYDVSVLARPDIPRDYAEITPDAIERLFAATAQLFPYVVIDFP